MARGTRIGARFRASGARAAVGFVVRGRRRDLARLAATALFGGTAEALFLIVVTRAAFAVTDGSEQVGIVAGWFLPVERTLLLALGLVAARITLASAAAWQSSRLSTTVVARLRHRLADAFLNASWELQAGNRAGSLQELLTGYTGQASSLVGALNQGVVASANLLALIVVAVAVDPLGACVLVATVAVLGLVLRPLRAMVRRRAHASTAAGMEFATRVNDVADLGMELHVFHVHEEARAQLGALIDRAQQASRRLQFAAGIATPIYSGLAYLALLGALAAAAVSSTASLTSLGAAMLVMLRSLSYGQALQGALVSVSASVPALDTIQERLAAFAGARREDGGEPVGAIGELRAVEVSFSYVPGQPVLRGISFSIEPHEIVGIVGPSGSGKSTLVQLLLGLRDPVDGRILASGRDLSSLSREDLARKITFVPQTPRLVVGSIAENIRFWRSGVSQADIERAARLAHVHEDIIAFPEGYDRDVGAHGGQLSGGQQQRLCIARALVEDPDVFILDEPTSSLDVRSEHLIRATLLELRQRMTVIVIAHRLSTLDVCGRIMVIQQGMLKGFDTPTALESSNDFYREALVLSGLR